MKTIPSLKVLLMMLLALLSTAAFAAEDAPTVAEQMSGLEAMCEASADARTARHLEPPLYERLGGYDRILEMTTEVVRLKSMGYGENEINEIVCILVSLKDQVVFE
jgi:hypothetical protein